MTEIEIRALGGYNEIGKNMTAVRVDNEVIILDCGIHLPNWISYTEDEDVINIDPDDLIAAGAIPDPSPLDDWAEMVTAIVPSHAHLDHIGAIPFLAGRFPNAKIISAPFTIEVLKTILRDERIKIPNKFVVVNPNHSIKIGNLEIELINITHSTPQSTNIAIHTPKGVIMYCNDFKLDDRPVLGKKPNYPALERIGKKGVILAIIECLYAKSEGKCPSESVAKEMLKDVMLNVDSTGKLVVITTFSSHIARLKSIIEMADKMGRKVVLIGRSLSKYVTAAKKVKIIDFGKIDIIKYNRQVEGLLKKINKKRDKYVLIVTGHQGEPKAKLSRLAKGDYNWKFQTGDHVIFSCNIIPSPVQFENRAMLEDSLRAQGIRLYKDIHVSGHGFREDLRDYLTMLQPQHILPSHGEPAMVEAFMKLTEDMGIPRKKVKNMHDQEKLIL